MLEDVVKDKSIQEEKQLLATSQDSLQSSVESVEPEEEDLIITMINKGDLEGVKKLLEEGYISPIPKRAENLISGLYQAIQSNQIEIAKILIVAKVDLDLQVPRDTMWTALHKSSSDGLAELISLLLTTGANPTIKGLDGKTAHDVSKNKTIRNIFRKYAGANPSQWDWEAAGIPLLTDEMEKDSEKKKLEKKKKKKKVQQEKQKQKKVEEKETREKELLMQQKEQEQKELQKLEKERKKKMESMTDRERRALAAELRFQQTQGGVRVCDFCSTSLTMVPFERLTYKYCSTKCVADHKKVINK